MTDKAELARQAAAALDELWHVPVEELESFVRTRPELGSLEAVEMARRERRAAIRELRRHPGQPGLTKIVLDARQKLIEGLAGDRPIRGLIERYRPAHEQVRATLVTVFQEMVRVALAAEGREKLALLREAIGMSRLLGEEAAEGVLSSVLGTELLMASGREQSAIEEVILVLGRALWIIPEHDRLWLQAATNLAVAYERRLGGDVVENWLAAASLLGAAVEKDDRAADPRSWAMRQTNYGYLLGTHPQGSNEEFLSRGITHILAGLEVRSPETNVLDWAFSQVNLGVLYQRRGEAGDNERAIDCYRAAAARLLPNHDLHLWTGLQHNLADTLLDAAPPRLAEAQAVLETALRGTDRDNDPISTARLIHQLARLAEHRDGAASREALRLRMEALDIASPSVEPELHLQIGRDLTQACMDPYDGPTAAPVYASMLTAFSRLYDAQVTDDGRSTVLERDSRLSRWAAYAFADTGHPERAVETLEQGQARRLSVAVSRTTADLAQLTAADPDLAESYQACLAQYRDAVAASRQPFPQRNSRQIPEAERQVRQVLSEIRGLPGLGKFLRPMTVTDICRAAGGIPVLYLMHAPAGSYALTVRPGNGPVPVVTSTPVPQVTGAQVARLVLDESAEMPGLIPAQSAGLSAVRAAIDRLGTLEPLLQPVADALADSPRNAVLLIPTGLLGLVPLHAIKIKGTLLDDLGEIRLAPSAAVYDACRRRAAQPRRQHFVGLADADPRQPLPQSRAELAAISRVFAPGPTSCAVGSQATKAWMLSHALTASHLHLACHGVGNFARAGTAELQLADDDWLTTDDLAGDQLGNCRLAVASACQSGHYAGSAPDEFLGLPSGFLQAGAACAVTTLWPINDKITTYLMTKFYELLMNDPNQTPVTALRHARKWLRTLTPAHAELFRRTHPDLPPIRVLSRTHATVEEAGNQTWLALSETWAAFSAWGY